MRKASRLLTFFLASALLCPGCGWLKDRTFTPSEAEKKLISFCLKEGGLGVVTKRLAATLWIYVPIEEPIFEIRPSRDEAKAERKVQPFSLLSLQAEFSGRYFKFSYDVVPKVLAGEVPSYGSGYNETYTKKRQLIYQAMQESFFNAEAKTDDPMPEFVVVMIADITKGLATKSTFYLKDLKRYITEAIPPDEYYIRELNEIVGRETLVGDKLGKNAPYIPVTWVYFLTEQMKNRIKSKIAASDLPDDTDPAMEMAKAAANTLRFYPFADYDGVRLYDIRAKKELPLTKEALKSYAEKAYWEDDKTKMTTIRFQLPKDPSSGMATIDTVTTAENKQPE